MHSEHKDVNDEILPSLDRGSISSSVNGYDNQS